MYHLIVNEESGAKRGAKELKKIKKYLDGKNIEYDVYSTQCQGDAKNYTKELTSRGANIHIIAVGGDGTFHEVINGIEDFENTTVGFVPAGRGNDFARGANIKRNAVKALDVILSNKITEIDYIDINGTRSLNFAGTGLDIEVLERVLKKKKSGKLAYIFSLMACLRKFESYEIEVNENGKTYNRKVIMVGVGNGGFFGGGIKISPMSDIADGKMNLVIINDVPHYKIPFMFISFLRGRHIKPKLKFYAEHIICDEVNIINKTEVKLQLDGEIYENLPFHAKLVKGRLKTFGL